MDTNTAMARRRFTYFALMGAVALPTFVTAVISSVEPVADATTMEVGAGVGSAVPDAIDSIDVHVSQPTSTIRPDDDSDGAPEGPSTTIEASSTTAAVQTTVTAPQTTTTTVAVRVSSAQATPPPTTPPTTAPPPPPTTAAPAAPPAAPPSSTSEQAFLACVRKRESGGNYQIVSANGMYFGAYQFLQSSWDSTANYAGRPDLVGQRPNTVSPADQDAMALALYHWQGSRPWGGACG